MSSTIFQRISAPFMLDKLCCSLADTKRGEKEQDTIKLTRESNDSQSLRADIEALKRRIVAGAGTERPSLLGPESSSARRRALLPPDLRENISNLVHKVGDTTSPVFPGDEAGQGKGVLSRLFYAVLIFNPSGLKSLSMTSLVVKSPC